MTAAIRSIGTALPSFSIDQGEAAVLAQSLRVTERWYDALPMLYRKSGVQRRSSVLLQNEDQGIEGRQDFYKVRSDQCPRGPTTAERMQAYSTLAGPLLEKSVVRSLREAELSSRDITHLVTVSCTGFCSPGIDHWLIDTLNMHRHISRTHVGFMGCHGLINGLRIAASICRSTPSARVLVSAVELCSLHQQYSEDAQQLVANSLFADGAASLVVVGDDTRFNSSGQFWEIEDSFSCMLPDTKDKMGWKIGDHGFEMQLSPSVPSLIQAQLRIPFENWLKGLSVRLDEISQWAIHPGGPRILDAVEVALDLEESKSLESKRVLADHGNMSSPTVAFILKRHADDHRQAKSKKGFAILLAFGPGLHVEAILLRA